MAKLVPLPSFLSPHRQMGDNVLAAVPHLAMGAGWGIFGWVLAMLLSSSAFAQTSSAAPDGLFARLDRDADGLLVAEEVADEHRRLFDRLLRRGDVNNDSALSVTEWAIAMTPTTPEKPIEEKRTGELPGADAARLLLLKLDTDHNRLLTKEEAPEAMQDIYERLVSQIDQDKNERIDRMELNRAGPKLGKLAQRVAREKRWNVPQELKRIEAKQGDAANRFDEPFRPLEALKTPKRAKELFAQLDRNADRQLVMSEIPGPLKGRFKQLYKRFDGDGNQRLSEQEFLAAARQISRLIKRQETRQAEQMQMMQE